MAWRNFPIVGMEDYQGEILDFSLLNRLSDAWGVMGTYSGDFTFLFKELNTISADQFLFGDDTNGFKVISLGSNTGGLGRLNGSDISGQNRALINSAVGVYNRYYKFTMYCCVDDETQKACLFALTYRQLDPPNDYCCGWAYNSNFMNSSLCYQLVTKFPIVSYNWQSVPSISGKNGISQPLSSHLDINDGEPITTSDTTKYSLNSNSNINKLVQDKLNS